MTRFTTWPSSEDKTRFHEYIRRNVTDARSPSLELSIERLLLAEQNVVDSCALGAPQAATHANILHTIQEYSSIADQVSVSRQSIAAVDLNFSSGLLSVTFDTFPSRDPTDPPTSIEVLQIDQAGVFKILAVLKSTGVIPAETQINPMFKGLPPSVMDEACHLDLSALQLITLNLTKLFAPQDLDTLLPQSSSSFSQTPLVQRGARYDPTLSRPSAKRRKMSSPSLSPHQVRHLLSVKASEPGFEASTVMANFFAEQHDPHSSFSSEDVRILLECQTTRQLLQTLLKIDKVRLPPRSAPSLSSLPPTTTPHKHHSLPVSSQKVPMVVPVVINSPEKILSPPPASPPTPGKNTNFLRIN